jgi:hypothetical protein
VLPRLMIIMITATTIAAIMVKVAGHVVHTTAAAAKADALSNEDDRSLSN